MRQNKKKGGKLTEGVGLVLGTGETFFAEAKVCHANVTLVGEKEVLWLEVTVDDSGVVQVLEREADLGAVELDALDRELLLALKVEEQLTAVDEVEDEVEFVVGLEAVMEVHEERVVQFLEDVKLRHCVIDLF